MSELAGAETDGSRARFRWVMLSALGGLTFLAFALVFAWRGQLNADEGWYLYAGRLVYSDQVPYRDFMFTQMPLLPYVYGLPQRLLGSSLLLGRLTSVALTLVSLVAGTYAARRIAGWPAAALCAWLLAGFAFGIYYQTLVKTYALVACCCTLVLVCLVSRGAEEWRFPLAALAALAASLTRLSAMAFAAVVVLYLLVAAKRWRTRGLVLGVVLAVGLLFILVWGRSWEPMRWNVLTYHMQRWPTTRLADRLLDLISNRLHTLTESYGIYLVLGFGLATAAVLAHPRETLRQPYAALTSYGLGLLAFGAAHFVGGGWHREYLAPLIVAAVPLMAILGVSLTQSPEPSGRFFVAGLIVGVILVSPLSFGLDRTDLLDDAPGLVKIDRFAELVRQNSASQEPMFALEAFWVAIEADRPLLPGLSMAQYSYLQVPREEALARHAVNGDIVAEYLEQHWARVVVFTDLDWQLVKASGHANRIKAALEQGYEPMLQDATFGQRLKPAALYVRKEP